MDPLARIRIIAADITTLEVDAIVNAANGALCGGGGVDGAIHDAAGPELLAECLQLGGCATGRTKVTQGYRLRAKHIIHAVGPVWSGGDRGERELLASCYQSIAEEVRRLSLRSIAIPAISCGAYRFPLDQAADIALETLRAELPSCESLEQVVFAMIDATTRRAYERSRLRHLGVV